MKQFFVIVFGGLGAIIVGVGIAYGGALGWRAAQPLITRIAFPSLSSVATADALTDGGTFISGMKRSIRYTASEEEDFLNATAETLSVTGKDISATGYLVKNLTLGTVSTGHNPDQLFPIASLTKLATAVVARQKIDENERVTITKEIMSTYGNTAFFSVGETFKASDLLYPLLMVSSNDAAEALARDYGRAKFIKAMNDWAQSIGAYRTYFADPSGLSPNNVSSANDYALILDWIRKNDQAIIDITSLKTKRMRSHTWTNPTHFLSWSYYAGGKNGYTEEANRTSAGLFMLGKDKNVYAVVVLGSENRDADVVKLLSKVSE